MIPRHKKKEVKELLGSFPAVALLGPRQVGKTTLAHEIGAECASTYLDLESVADRARIADPVYYCAQHSDKLIIIDEVQREPELFQSLRGIIDHDRREGRRSARFLLLGSASIDLLKQSGESLAGRIAYAELSPVNSAEYPGDPDQLWLRGGFPDSLLANNDSTSLVWRNNFIRTYLERDIPQLGPRIPAETLRRFWTMLAHNQGGILNISTYAAGLGVDGKTVMRYLDLMVDLLLVRRLQPLHRNIGKRLIKSPKVYIRDAGLVHALLNIEDREQLLGHPVVGFSWEGFVLETIINCLNPHRYNPHYYRTSSGNEIDLIIEKPGFELRCIEIKRNPAPRFTKAFRLASEAIGSSQNYIVYPGQDSYPLADNTRVIGLEEMVTEMGGW
jgi:predicted AAA+ superfamily ATPase